MIDESFRLTPVEARNWEFGRKLNGYDPAKVESFRDQVADEMERLLRLNADLDSKAKGLVEQLRAYRERDKALNDALVSAQQLRSEIREQAEREAQLILREARAEGDKIVEEARARAREVEMDIAGLEKSRRTFLRQLRALAEQQLQELDAIESVMPSQAAEHRPDEAGRPAAQTPAWLNSLVKE
ncbi:MAG TPA: DivIVA domain-containing protein [Gemmatimonadaceae bacterium]|nr:DivIVA domain-containing protein [Gemmatimonadaceae bacterium]